MAGENAEAAERGGVDDGPGREPFAQVVGVALLLRESLGDLLVIALLASTVLREIGLRDDGAFELGVHHAVEVAHVTGPSFGIAFRDDVANQDVHDREA